MRERARVENKSLEQVVDEALRREFAPRVGEGPGPVYQVKPVDGGVAAVEDPKRYKGILNDEDDERYLRLTYGDDSARWPDWLRDRRGIRGDNSTG